MFSLHGGFTRTAPNVCMSVSIPNGKSADYADLAPQGRVPRTTCVTTRRGVRRCMHVRMMRDRVRPLIVAASVSTRLGVHWLHPSRSVRATSLVHCLRCVRGVCRRHSVISPETAVRWLRLVSSVCWSVCR